MIELRNISKSFGDRNLFDNFNLTIEQGEYVVFCGVSGCGKTTLLNIIGSLEPVDNGTVLVDNKNISIKKNQREYLQEKVGFLFQNFALVENKTVRKNLELVQTKHRINLSIDDALKAVGLEDKNDTMVYKLSGGEQQRVALARLMIKKCNIILADEPTGSLDTENAKTVLQILKQLNESGKTVILVTHDERIIYSGKRVIRL